ncbi:MAG: peptidoglycan-binding protein [Verrucomicrobiales bacterium]|nr:peptidoglycan-binding protein [Verrucomicrobiales bacterium]
MDTHGHETVARIGREVLADALNQVGRGGWNLQSFYLGNWLTDVSQAIDPVAYASFRDEATDFASALHSFAAQIRDLSSSKVRVPGLGFDLPTLPPSVVTGLRNVAAELDKSATSIEEFAKVLDVQPGRRGELADLLRKAMRVKGYFKFAHPEKRGGPPRLAFNIYKHVFGRNFTQYYPHEHLDRFPAELDVPTGWPQGGYAEEVASATRTPDQRPGTGSRLQPHIYRFLVDDIEIAAGLLATIDKVWAKSTFQPGNTNWNDQDPEWNQWLADLGHALHAFEDFFAHSNFIEHALDGLSDREKVLNQLGLGGSPSGHSPAEIFQRRLKKVVGSRKPAKEPGEPGEWVKADSFRFADWKTWFFDWKSLPPEAHVVTGYFDFIDTFFSLRHVVEELFGGGNPVHGKVTAVDGKEDHVLVTIDIGASSRVRKDSHFKIYRGGTLKIAEMSVISLEEDKAQLKIEARYALKVDPEVGDEAYLTSANREQKIEKGEDFAALLRGLCLLELKAQSLRNPVARSVSKAEVKGDLPGLIRLISGTPAAQINLPGLQPSQLSALEAQWTEETAPEVREQAQRAARDVLDLPRDAGEIREDLFDVVASICQRSQAGGPALFERLMDGMEALEFLLNFSEYLDKYLFAGLPKAVRAFLKENITGPIESAIDNLVGRYRIGCHSLLAKDYEWGDDVLDQLYERARNLSRALHWYAVKTLTRWTRQGALNVCRAPHPASGTESVNTADCPEWVDWHELFEFFLRHPHGQPVQSTLPQVPEKERWWYPIVLTAGDDAWTRFPLYPSASTRIHRWVFYPEKDRDEFLKCRDRMKTEAEAFYDTSRDSNPKPPPQHKPHPRTDGAKSPDGPPPSRPNPDGTSQSRRPIPAPYLPNHTDVSELQTRLKELGFDPGDIDGDWGPNTRAAVITFQRAHPPLEDDGVYGPLTRDALDEAVNG